MAVLQVTPTAPNQRTIDHIRPLDSVLVSLQEVDCARCQSILKVLLNHLHEYIPVEGAS